MLVATDAKSMLEKSNFPDASAVAVGAAALANSTVTSAFVANFFTDCFRVMHQRMW